MKQTLTLIIEYDEKDLPVTEVLGMIEDIREHLTERIRNSPTMTGEGLYSNWGKHIKAEYKLKGKKK